MQKETTPPEGEINYFKKKLLHDSSNVMMNSRSFAKFNIGRYVNVIHRCHSQLLYFRCMNIMSLSDSLI